MALSVGDVTDEQAAAIGAVEREVDELTERADELRAAVADFEVESPKGPSAKRADAAAADGGQADRDITPGSHRDW